MRPTCWRSEIRRAHHCQLWCISALVSPASISVRKSVFGAKSIGLTYSFVLPIGLTPHGSRPNSVHDQSIFLAHSPSPREETSCIDLLAASEPRTALASTLISDLFSHYVNDLAPWYDLNDSGTTFGTVVPQNALDCSFLFKALTAFSAGHQCKVHGIDALEAIATAFHTACVRELLQSISQAGTRSYDNELATACLLRSYEIITGNA